MTNYQWSSNPQILKYIDTLTVQTKYINAIVLDNQNRPLRAIQGRATGGSININNNSPVRRSGSISMITDYDETAKGLDVMHRITDVSSLLSLNKRLSIEVGIINSGNQYTEFPIFWFSLGVFLFSNASVRSDASGIRIDLTLTDKMGLLNGEVGGEIPALYTFSPDENNHPRLFYEILKEILIDFGGLTTSEIILEDIPYEITTTASYQQPQVTTDGEGNEITEYITIYGKGITSFTFPQAEKLIANPGDTVVSILDKIKSELVDYEYFFDINGIFHFQRIKDYTWEGSAENDITRAVADKFLTYSSGEQFTYTFEEQSPLVIAYQNTPAYSSIKNDFHVWGQTTEAKLPIHYHLILSNMAATSQTYHPDALLQWYPNSQSQAQVFLCDFYNSDEQYNLGYTTTISNNSDGEPPLLFHKKQSGLWIKSSPYLDYGKRTDITGIKDQAKLNCYCSSLEFITRPNTFYQLGSGQLTWDGRDVFTRWIINAKNWQGDPYGKAAQVIWSRANPTAYTTKTLTELRNSRSPLTCTDEDSDESVRQTYGAIERQIEFTGRYLICRIRHGNANQRVQLSTAVIPKDASSQTSGLRGLQREVHNLDPLAIGTNAQIWHTYYIDLKSFATTNTNNWPEGHDGWGTEAKNLVTLMFTFPWERKGLSGTFTNRDNYIDIDFIALTSGGSSLNNDTNLVTALKDLYPNDYIISMRASGRVIEQDPVVKQDIPPACSWQDYLKLVAICKNNKKMPLSRLESEILAADNDNKQYYKLNILDTSLLKGYPKLYNYLTSHSIENIGQRTKVIEDEKINCLEMSERLDYIFVTKEQAHKLQILRDAARAHKYYILNAGLETEEWIQLGGVNASGKIYISPRLLTVNDFNAIFENGLWDYQHGGTPTRWHSFKNSQKYYCLTESEDDTLKIGEFEKSAEDVMRSVLHEYLSYNNRINLTTIPIYHLDANQRIKVECEEADIHGDYIIESITLPLDFESTMSISARQVMERI